MNEEQIYLFHQTPPELAKKLIEIVPLEANDKVYEPFKGEGAFFTNFPSTVQKLWAEIRQGKDYKEEQEYDWVITNPPFRITEENTRVNGFWITLDYFTQRAKKGVAFLFNKKCLEALTPRRLDILQQRGFYVEKIVVCNVKKWAGRYYFLILRKQPSHWFIHIKESF